MKPTYGEPGDNNWGKVQVTESWAEFIGTENARRRYGDIGFKRFTELGDFANLSLINIDQENIFSANWIPTGFYYDLIDNVNAFAPEDAWDNVGGSSIHDMYYVFNSNTNGMCDYLFQFQKAYPTFFTPVRTMFDITDHYSTINPNNFPCF